MKATAARARGAPPAPAGPPQGGRTVPAFLLVAGSAALLCGPLLAHGPLPLGSDVFLTMHYLQAFMESFSDGDLLPRWTDSTNQGLGAPTFIFYPPLFYYAAGAAAWVEGSAVGGIKLCLAAVALLTAWSFHLLARDWIGRGAASAAASALYLLLPYHVLDMYQRFAMAETTAFVFMPLVVLFARRAVRDEGPSGFAGLAASWAGLLYTHVVTAFILSLFLGPWIAWECRGRWRRLARPALGLLCGAGLAAPMLLPAAVEKSEVNISWMREMPNGDFRINFIFKDEPIPGLGFKDPVKPPVLRSAHSQLLLAAVAAALALLWLSKDQAGRRRDVAALAAGCGIAYIFQLEASTPLWRIIPELPTVQFPWRFQVVMVLASALLGGCALQAAAARARGRGGGAASTAPGLTVLGVVVIVNLAFAGRNAFLKPFTFDEAASKDAGVVGAVEPGFTPVAFEPYRTFKWRRIDLPLAAFVEGGGQVQVIAWKTSAKDLEVESAAGGRVAIRHFWFPGWTGTIDGGPLEVGPSSPHGTMTFDVPAGRHRIGLRFGPTPARRAARWVFLGSLAATAALAWAFRRPGGAGGPPSRPAGRAAAAAPARTS